MICRYRACGFDIVAPFPLTGFWPAPEAAAAREITLEIGAVPAALAEPVCTRALLQIDAAGDALHHAPGVARYFLRQRRRVTIEPSPGGSMERAIDYFARTPLALLCLQWGLVPLGAACVARNGAALLLASVPGEGKSTLALAFAESGMRICADEICALEIDARGGLRLWPHRPQLRLWPDSLAAVGETLRGGPTTPGGRVILAADENYEPSPVVPRAIAMLKRSNDPKREGLTASRGAAAFESAMRLRLLVGVAGGFLDDADTLRKMAALASAATVLEARFPDSLTQIATTRRRLEAALPTELAPPDACVAEAGA